MYKCKECGTEFETKPEYCDCGNDTFDEIMTNDNVDDFESEHLDSPQKEIIEPIQQMQQAEIQVPERSSTKIKNNTDITSLVIFSICIILSLLVLFVIGNPKESVDSQNNRDLKVNSKIEIPSIDILWNNAPNVNSENTTKSIQKTNSIENQSIQTNKISENSISKPVKNEDKQQIKQTNNTTKTTISQNRNKNSSKLTAVQNQTPAKNTAEQKQELQNYKMRLRNNIATKIDFASVIGDGNCSISFTLDKNGKLTNRKFSKQSENDSLNDAVYNAMMKTPVYNVPPTLYKNEILHLNVKIVNGNFEVSLY